MMLWRGGSALALLILGGAHGASAEPARNCADANYPLGMAYRGCVESKARLLEPSGESADSVATAAISACHEARHTLRASLMACGGDGLADAATTELDRGLHDKAIEIVVEARARRHSRAK